MLETAWLTERWTEIFIPLIVFLATLIVIFWLRRFLFGLLDRWEGNEMLLRAIRTPSIFWALLLSAYPALTISPLSSGWKALAGRGLWTLFLLSLTLTALNIGYGFISFYGEKLKAPSQGVNLARNIIRIALPAVAILILLSIWGVPTTPILLLIVIAILAMVVILREAISNLFAWFELQGRIKVGDFIKLETGEGGYVVELSLMHVRIKAPDESTIFIPNSKLVQYKFICFGQPIKKAKVPFRFYSRVHLKEATGLEAKNLKELAELLAQVPGSVIYYHTHQFLEEHHYLTPQPSNDFAMWVTDALGDEVLGEKLAAISVHDFPTIRSLREKLLEIINEALSQNPYLREALPGKEFHFIKSTSIILPTPYVAHDLREFAEALGKVSLGSLYFHIFEARLRLERGLNDFSLWLEDSLGERELATKIAQLDPYVYTLEGLRTKLIELIEERLK